MLNLLEGFKRHSFEEITQRYIGELNDSIEALERRRISSKTRKGTYRFDKEDYISFLKNMESRVNVIKKHFEGRGENNHRQMLIESIQEKIICLRIDSNKCEY